MIWFEAKTSRLDTSCASIKMTGNNVETQACNKDDVVVKDVSSRESAPTAAQQGPADETVTTQQINMQPNIIFQPQNKDSTASESKGGEADQQPPTEEASASAHTPDPAFGDFSAVEEKGEED